MAIQKGLVDSLKDLIDFRLLSLFTMIPARVVAVNYKENHLNAQPLIRTKGTDDSQHTSPEMAHVPMFVLSANRGKARITLPVKIGDTVLILYSQRSLGEFYNSNGEEVVDTDSTITHGCYPIMALPCLFTKASAVPINSSDIVVENGSTTLVMNPSGDITATCPTFVVNGNLEINGNSTLNGDEAINGDVTHIGNNIQTGNLATTGGISVTGALTNAGVPVGSTHTHTQGNDSGNDTQVPTSPPVP